VKHGYVVLLPNIRGSSGYGRAFEKANDRCWGRCDMEDVVAGVDYLRTLAGVDADRVAVTGTSYGGFMSIAAATFASGIFKAAVPTRTGYADWTPDRFALAEVKLLEYELGPFAEHREVYRRSSPFFFAQDLDTPLLLIGGEGDTPMRRFAAEAGRFYKPARYSGQSGDIDSAENRVRWMAEMRAFLDQHLKPAPKGPGSTGAQPGKEPRH
jgi:dipeptidyl aminopeptidase/acylaminoacyl peptidase